MVTDMDALEQEYVKLKAFSNLTKKDLIAKFGEDTFNGFEQSVILQKRVAEAKIESQEKSLELGDTALELRRLAMAKLRDIMLMDIGDSKPGALQAQSQAAQKIMDLTTKEEVAYLTQRGRNKADSEFENLQKDVIIQVNHPDPGEDNGET